MSKKLCREHWSPEAIANTLGKYFPGESIHHSTIYEWIKQDRPELKKYLRERGERRRQRVMHRRGRFKTGVPEKRSIELRPAIVQSHTEFGHLEGDTIVCADSRTVIVTLRELKTRMRWYFKLPNREAKTVMGLLVGFFQSFPSGFFKTITFDRGTEFALSHLLEKLFSVEDYYCHAYAAWEKGSVENANRELRWYVPKGTDLAQVNEEDIAVYGQLINARPMKCLEWRSATEVFEQELSRAIEKEHLGSRSAYQAYG